MNPSDRAAVPAPADALAPPDRAARQHPGLEDRVPHHHLASYPGLAPASLGQLLAPLRKPMVEARC